MKKLPERKLTPERRQTLLEKHKAMNPPGMAILYENEQDVIFESVYDFYINHEQAQGDFKKAFRALWEWKETQIKKQSELILEIIGKAKQSRSRNAGRKFEGGEEKVRAFLIQLGHRDKGSWGEFKKFCGPRGPGFKSTKFYEIVKRLKKQ